MPDYVYALHDFQPEHDDEVSFRQGERIEVIERDDLYSDGWWQGRNLAGKFGLFPQSYTTAAPPTTGPPSVSMDLPVPQGSGTLLPLHEEPESLSPNEHGAANGIGNIVNSHVKQPSQGEEVMKATMTDVQKAIEQLNRNNGSGVRDDRSFSFTSMMSRDGDADTDTDIDMDTDREPDASGDDWHRDARMKLAEQARKVVEEQKRREEEDTPVVRTIAPPIEVEMSDESEGEDDDDVHQHTGYARDHPHISEEDEDEAEAVRAYAEPKEGHVEPFDVDAAIPDESQLPTATVQRTAFSNLLPVTQSAAAKDKHSSVTSLPTPISPGSSSNAIPSVEPVVHRAVTPTLSIPEKRTSQITPTPTPSTAREAHAALPSPAASPIGRQQTSKHSSLASSTGHALNSLPSPASERTASMDKKPTTHPSEWTVEEVIDWLRSKGFGDDVCDKFIEQEITGDVLLDLDVNLLKSEIGIPAFGKRMRIANFVADLRRPPSVVYSDHVTNQSQSISQSQSQPYGFSHSHSLSQSVHSSAQTSLNSPYYTQPFSPGFGSIMSVESPMHTGDLPGTPSSPLTKERRVSDPVSIAGRNTNVDADDRATGIRGGMVGLGLGVPGAYPANVHKNRPTQLMLSPSDSNLVTSKAVGGDTLEEADEERAVASENENAHTINKRRHIFGHSKESGSSTKHDPPTNKLSKEAPPSPHPSAKGSSDEHAVSRGSRRQRSMDSSRPADRHSLFGNPFNGTIGKSRKPAPRYSLMDHDPPSEKHSTLNLSRLYGGSNRKSSGRPSTSDGSTSATSPKELKGTKEKEEKKEKEKKAKTTEKGIKDETEFGPSTVLRKRTELNGEIPTRSMQPLKPGQRVLEQIGEPDHKGWMRKKGDRYNSWKSRYFVLKGPHLYILKSDDKSETKIKGYVNIVGYKVLADENTDPGRYGFRIVHDTDKTHFFSSTEHNAIREWMKAIMKATIGRDYTKAVVSSCNIPTIPLTVAQAMNPAPRPPSPTARAATQRAHRQENPNQLTSRDARVLMSLLSTQGTEDGQPTFFDSPLQQDEKRATSTPPASANLPPVSFNAPQIPPTSPNGFSVPPRPSRRSNSVSTEFVGIADVNLIEWANSHLPPALQIRDPEGSLCGGLALFRLAESIRGKPSSPPVLDSAFPSGPNDDKLDGLFKLFDFLLDNDVKVGSVSINEVRQGKRDKIVQLLIALKAWDDKRKAIEQSIVKGGPANVSYWAHV